MKQEKFNLDGIFEDVEPDRALDVDEISVKKLTSVICIDDVIDDVPHTLYINSKNGGNSLRYVNISTLPEELKCIIYAYKNGNLSFLKKSCSSLIDHIDSLSINDQYDTIFDQILNKISDEKKK